MAGFVRAVAVDLDGTLADGAVTDEVVEALRAVRDQGIELVLVTGRIKREMEAHHPGLDALFDAVVTENGAVLTTATGTRPLAGPVDAALADALRAAGVTVRAGEVLLACDGAHLTTVVATITRLGLDCQVVHNRAALMVLPAGVSKGTGLRAALDELDVSPHNVLAVGDAENDLALLDVAEVGVAVANAVPSLAAHADLVLGEADGAGMLTLLASPLLSGEEVLHPLRRRLRVGTYADGTVATVPGAQANILVCGGPGAGKSHFAGLLCERWSAAGYSYLVLDPEGDHVPLERLRGTVVLDATGGVDRQQLAALLRRRANVVVDLSGLSPEGKLAELRDLPQLAEAERAGSGLPHWVLVDEAHVPLGEGGVAADVFRPAERGYCLVTYQPELLCAEALAAIDVVVALAPAPVPGAVTTASLRLGGELERRFTVDRRVTTHVRHQHKYATSELPTYRRFAFRHPDGTVVGTAGSIREFARQVRACDDAVLHHHLLRGDFSRWLTGTVQDRELGAAVAAVERGVELQEARAVQRARDQLLRRLSERYLDT